MPEPPRIAFVLATDREATIESVLQCLRAQTVKAAVEIVVVCPEPDSMRGLAGLQSEFGAFRLVRDPVRDLAEARSAGVMAATAPLVFIGETHSFPRPDLAERTVEAFEDARWSIVIPSLRNGNPDGVLSWSGFLCDYGMWAAELGKGEFRRVPVYNATFRTAILTALGPRLRFALGQTDELEVTLRAQGHRALFLPETCVEHVNTTLLWKWMANRFLGGLSIASNRSREWSAMRRLLHAGSVFLIPAVLWPRMRAGIRARKPEWPRGTMAAVAFSLMLRAAGEFFGYAHLFGARADAGMMEIELHKLDYARSRAAGV